MLHKTFVHDLITCYTELKSIQSMHQLTHLFMQVLFCVLQQIFCKLWVINTVDYLSACKLFAVCDPILENRRCTHNNTFVINRNTKTMGRIQKSNNKIMQVIDCLDSQ